MADAERKVRKIELADRLGYPPSISIDSFDRGVVLAKDELPGVPLARRADGVRQNYRLVFIKCDGCGRARKLIQENGEKKYRCGTPGYNRPWHRQLVNELGQPQALVMKHL